MLLRDPEQGAGALGRCVGLCETLRLCGFCTERRKPLFTARITRAFPLFPVTQACALVA